MTRRQIDFYLLQAPTWQDCQGFVCQLTAKIYQQGLQLGIIGNQLAALQRLSKQLWIFQANQFIPHYLKTAGTQPILWVSPRQLPETTTPPLLLALQLLAPDDLYQPARLLQIVPNDPALIDTARGYYRHYQQQGYELKTHRLGPT